MADDKNNIANVPTATLENEYIAALVDEIEGLRAEMQQVRLDHITTLAELQEAAAEIEWLKEALTDAQNEARRG